MTTTQSTADAVHAFIQTLRERLQAARPAESDQAAETSVSTPEDWVDAPTQLPEPIEIKMGREIVYRDGYAHKDPINKLNPNTLKLLQAAIDASPSEDATATTEMKGTINIKAGDDLVYRMSQGTVETNRLQSNPVDSSEPDPIETTLPAPDEPTVPLVQAEDAVPVAQAPDRDPPPPSVEPTPSPAVVQAEPTIAVADTALASSADPTHSPPVVQTESMSQPQQAVVEDTAPVSSSEPAHSPSVVQSAATVQPQQSTAAQPLALSSPKLVSILNVLERQNQQVKHQAARNWMQQTTRIMQRSSQQVADRVVAIAAHIRSRQVAATAVDLLRKYGTSERPGRGLYQSESYTLRARGRMMTIADREGTELMIVRQTRWGLDILKNDMGASQEAEFMRARQQIQIQGIDGLSSEPPLRVRQLGNLAPEGDHGITRDLTALALAQTARKLLDVTGSRPNIQGKRVFQGGSQYRIEETPHSLKVQTTDRGAILSIDNGKIHSELKSRDVAYFRFIDRELSRDLQASVSTSVTPLNRTARSRRAGLAMGE